MRKLFEGESPWKPVYGILFALALLIGACASSGEVRWAHVQQATNDASNWIIDGRRPCVDTGLYPDAGPDHPLCLIDNEKWEMFKALRRTINATLSQALLALEVGDSPRVTMYLNQAAQLLLDLQKIGAI